MLPDIALLIYIGTVCGDYYTSEAMCCAKEWWMVNEDGIYHEEKVSTVDGDYARVYDGIYDSIVNGKEQVIQPWQTILQMEMLETGVKDLE